MERGPIVVGVDFSDASRVAIEHASMLASKLGVSVHVVHAWNPTGWNADVIGDDPAIALALDRAREHAQAQLAVWAGFAGESAPEVTSEITDGAASRMLPEIAERQRASLVVVGRHGHASLAHVFLGSVSERLVRLSPCPVLIVPPRSDAVELPSRLLVGVDFSSGAREALHVAAGLARRLGCAGGLLLVHAYQDEREAWLASWSEAHLADTPHNDERSIRQWVRKEPVDDVELDFAAVPGYAEQRIPATAQERDCDWIVLGVQGRSAIASFLIGSTTQRILRLADRPVLVAPARHAPDSEGVD